ncbi:MAG TPA: Wzz/FepE/Etk N-terminal domain-containing protein [Vicinamibacterales bacterium]|nr:Wzz/FepE/Etk N-terminal domain-containing protein [Vicinamibacterales bacterium]
MIPGKQYTPEDIALILWRRKWWAILPAIVIAAGVYAWVRTLPNLYRSDTLILVVPQRVPENYVKSTVTTRIEDRLQSIQQQILSRTRLERIIQDFNLYAEARKTAIMEDVVERMRGNISVQVVKGDAFRVSFTSDEARTAMRVCERVASLFIEENLRDREVLAEGTNQFLEAQLEDARRRLIETERKVEEYKRTYSGELPEQREANMQGLHNIEMQLQSLTEAMNRDRDRRLIVERLLADAESPEPLLTPPPPPSGPVQVGPDGLPVGATAAQQLEAAQATLQQMQTRLTPQHPDILRMKRVITELQKKADAEALARPVSVSGPAITPAERLKKNRIAEMKSELEKIDKQLAARVDLEQRLRASMTSYQKHIEAAAGRQSDLTELSRDYLILQSTYQSLLGKKEDSKVAANLERRQIGEQFKILDPARLPERPTSPNRPQLQGMGLAAGIGFGMALMVLIEYLDKTLKSEADVTAALNLLVLATVPILPEIGSRVARRRKLIAISATLLLTVAAGAAAVAWRVWK